MAASRRRALLQLGHRFNLRFGIRFGTISVDTLSVGIRFGISFGFSADIVVLEVVSLVVVSRRRAQSGSEKLAQGVGGVETRRVGARLEGKTNRSDLVKTKPQTKRRAWVAANPVSTPPKIKLDSLS